jgi:hypothetical protein
MTCGADAAHDGAVTALNRNLHRRRNSRESNELKYRTALTTLTARNRGPSPPGGGGDEQTGG